MKKFNGHRCERRNLTDLVLGTGPDGKPRPKPKAKKRPKKFTKEPAANKKVTGGPVSPMDSLLGVISNYGLPGYTRSGNMSVEDQALMQYINAAQGRLTEGMSPGDAANLGMDLMRQKMDQGLRATAQSLYGQERSMGMGQPSPNTTPAAIPNMNPGAISDPLAGIQEIDMEEENFPLDFTQSSLRRDRRQFDRAQKIADRQAAKAATTGGATPGQEPGKLAEMLGDDAKASAISAGGQALGELFTGLDKNASDPGAKYGVGEGFGAAISGATNPLAMAFGPVGMGVGAALGFGASVFKHKKEKDEFERLQEEARDERIANETAAAQSFSDQVLQTYSQEGVGGGLYAYYGGSVNRFYTGGPTEPPAVMPGMEQYESFQNLNPELAGAVANMPERNDRLTNFSDAELRRNEQMQADRVAADNLQKAKDVAGNVAQFHMDKPLDALGMDLAILGQVPVVGEVADLANAGISGTRALYNTAVGDTAKAQEQAVLASLSAASAIPFFGNVAGVSRVAKGADTLATGMNVGKAAHHVAHGAHDIERAVIAGKGVKAATYEGKEMGGPVDYETEKSEVILASPNDPPVAVGQGKYTQVSENLYRAKGPSHKHGGIPTRGATEPFVDNTGTYNNSPYVFSDAKEMRFDPSEILSMIA